MLLCPDPGLRAILQSDNQAEQLHALRLLKNIIVGHVQKKEKWMEGGVLDLVVGALESSKTAANHSRRDSRENPYSTSASLSTVEAVRLQALQILASFTSGGYDFLPLMHSSGALAAILSNIRPNDDSPIIVNTALTAATNIAQATSLALPTSATELASLANVVFSGPLVAALRDILNSQAAGPMLQTQRDLVAKLISLLCLEEQHQVLLADSGILDALATNLASVIVARGYAIPGAESTTENDGTIDEIPLPAAPTTDVTAILEALSVAIGESAWRACALINSPAILAIFPTRGSSFVSPAVRAEVDALEAVGMSQITSKELGIMDCLLPLVPDHQTKATAISHFPPLGSTLPTEFQPWSRSQSSANITVDGFSAISDNSGEDSESPLIPWLIITARSAGCMEKIVAASLVTALFKAGFAHKAREAYLGMLVVPILLENLGTLMLTSNNVTRAATDAEIALNRSMIERALAVLAKLTVDSDHLQKCAVDCSAVKMISTLLKNAYEPLSLKAPGARSATSQHGSYSECQIGLPTTRSGSGEQPPLLAHHIRIREAALKAIAALAGKDENGKAFVDQEVVPFIVESLYTAPSKPTKDRPQNISLVPDDGQIDPAYGANPKSVIIAACHALRTLSRSVGILRTTLHDCGVVGPAFRLLRDESTDIEVRVAVSGLICNLVTSMSPVRDRLDTVGVMRVLCKHTKSHNPALRLNALWALKHWVDGATIESKKESVEELTPGWLVQLIREDTEDEALYQRTTSRPTENKVDEDVEMTQGGEFRSVSAIGTSQTAYSPRFKATQIHSSRLRQASEKIAELREVELSPVRKVRDDDLAIQEQGLNFLRNLIGPFHTTNDTSAEHAEMIDYLFTVLDPDRFFEIMHSKLQLKVLHPFGRRYASSRKESRVLYPQSRIVEAMIYILVHLAASVPRHRQILISQTKLLTDLGKHFQSKDKNVRVALCHLISNLTWRDNPEDSESSKARASELKKLGLLTKLELLESDDGELDVRERAKAAIWQIKKPGY